MKTVLLALIALIFSYTLQAQYVEQASIVNAAITGTAQGSDVAISADGMVAVVGAEEDSSGFGTARVYVRNGANWVQQGAKLKPTGFIISGVMNGILRFGSRVAISGDGSTIMIAAPDDDIYRGAVWVFVRNGNNWVQQGPKLTGTGNTFKNAYFGDQLALSFDGNTAVIGGSNNDGGVGSAWIFIRNGTTWSQQGPKLIPPVMTTVKFGESVAITPDGNKVIIGCISYKPNSANTISGAGFIFKRNGTTWVRDPQELRDSVSLGRNQGYSVAWSADTSTIAIGVFGAFNTKGAVDIYTHNGTNWEKQTRLPFLSPIGGSGGYKTALSYSGDTVAFSSNSNAYGRVNVYARSGTTWSLLDSSLTVKVPAPDRPKYGNGLAMSADGKILLVGAPGMPPLGTGVVKFYSDSAFILATSETKSRIPITVYPNPAKEILNFSGLDINQHATIELFDLSGKKVLKTLLDPNQERQVSISKLSPGIYFVSVQQANGTKHFKIIKD